MRLRELTAEFIGTFVFVAAVCGTALLAGPSGDGGISIAVSAGLTILAMGFALGHISGAHFNPAVTLGLVAGGRFEISNAAAYIPSHVLGGISAALLFAVVMADKSAGDASTGSFLSISNTFGNDARYGVISVFLIEFIATGLFVLVIMGSTSRYAQLQFAPIAIGSSLVFLYLIALPVSNASLNPARSTATAPMAGWQAIADLWLFWVAPIAGGVAGGLLNRLLQEE